MNDESKQFLTSLHAIFVWYAFMLNVRSYAHPPTRYEDEEEKRKKNVEKACSE